MQPTEVMIVEDERIVALHLKQQLAKLGYTVNGVAASGANALAAIEQHRPDVVLMDIHIEGEMDGIETAARIEDIPVIYLTAYSEDATLERARLTHPFGYLVKPISERELHATIQMALKRREIESALHDSRELLGLALDAAEMGSWEVDAGDKRIRRDHNACRIIGIPAESASADLADFYSEIFADDRSDVAAGFDRLLSGREPCQVKFRRVRPDDGVRWLKAQGRAFQSNRRKVRRVIGVVQDITDEIERERRRRITERLETLGTLAGGIAHDINNMLVPILIMTPPVMESLPDGDPRREHLAMVTDSAQRIRQVVAQILAFGRQERQETQVLDLHEAIHGAMAILRATIPSSVTVRDRLDRDTGLIEAAPAQIDVLLINLAVNAAQAIGQTAGAVDVMLDRLVIPETGDGQIELPPGPYARIAVSDDGCGMDAKTLERIFEPFFTTKPAGEGTGLGLSVVFGTVTQLGGAIDVRSEVGAGSTFIVYLPLISGKAVH